MAARKAATAVGVKMKCLWCGADNHEDDHRCKRCGRRLRVSRPQPAPETYPVLVRTSAVPQTASHAPAAVGAPEPPAERPRPTQAKLAFETESPRVIPFQAPGAKRPDGLRRRPAGVSAGRRARLTESINLELALHDAAQKEAAEAAPRSFLYGYARAASPMHRALAAALDWSMVVIATGVFLLAFHLGGGELVFTKSTIPIFIAIPVLIALFYEALCALGGGITAGMKWTRLRLLNFDGRKPSTKECLWRVLGIAISMAAIGLGYLWALFDEESLGWQDHISKTFPSPSQIHRPF